MLTDKAVSDQHIVWSRTTTKLLHHGQYVAILLRDLLRLESPTNSGCPPWDNKM
uniref:Uncharacterized protein n=1 Tax=Arion vulgaris TaxID=1028688 RepID=A0A0B7A8I7_9EUPU